MAVSLEQFVQYLTASGLMSATEISSFQENLPPAKRPQDAETLARALVQARKLTKYQAQVVYQGKVKGLVFGEYVVLDKLGQGGMGVVLKAQHRRMDRIVAVKMISGAALKSPDAVKRFYREVKAAARLEHTNIVAAHDAGEHEGGHYLVMQYVDGKDLGAIVKEKGPLPIARAVDYVIQAARGLQYAHKQGIVHRDIKPANLLVDKEGTVKILDMGLARIAGLVDEADADRLTASGQVMGTCDYMAPEQAVDTHHADHRADIYALGCTLYRLLTGEVLYKGDTLTKILLAHQLSAIPSLCQVRGDVPPQLDAVFQKMVAKKPEDRQQSMADVIAELEGCLGKRAATITSFNNEATADLSMDDNLSFLRQQTSPHSRATAAKKKVEELTEATIAHQAAAADTSKQLSKGGQLLGDPRKKKTLIVTVAAGLVGIAGIVSVYLAITIRVRHPDGSETVMRVPDGSQVTVTKDSDGTSVLKQASYGVGAPPLAKPSMSSSEAAQTQKQWADHLGVPVETTNSIGMKLVLIPPGEFDMGASPEEIVAEIERAKKNRDSQGYFEQVNNEGPRHRVKISKSFYLAMYQVTQGEYEKVMGVNPSAFTENQMDASAFKPPLGNRQKKEREDDARKMAGKDTSRHPLEMVTWDNAVEFCRTLSALSRDRTIHRTYRLPTEAEWEYACRAGATTRWHSGNDETGVVDVAWFGMNAGGMTHPVGEKKPNAWGLYDMHGNVYQWCADWFGADYYKQSPLNDPAGPAAGRDRVLRGGGWNYNNPFCCRSAYRFSHGPASRNLDFGFRVVCEIVPRADVSSSTSDRLTLFDGKTLNGWHLRDPNGPHCWAVEDGQLVCTPQPSSDGKNLCTDQTFRDFELHLDFMLEPQANSGVYLRGLYEVQVYDDNSEPVPPDERCGAIWKQIAPSKKAYLGPERWNTLNVKMAGQHVTVTMNGERIIDNAYVRGPTSGSSPNVKEGDPGPIMLQCMAQGRTRFRNITIRRIEGRQAAESRQPANNMRGNIDFMPLIDPQKDGALGKWARSADGITVTKANEATVLRLPYLPPEEYDFEIEFTPQGDGMNVNQYIAVGGRSFAWKLNSHGRQPPLYGFELLDGKFAKDLDEAAVHKPKRMESGKRYTSRVEVRRGSLRALVEGEEYVKWSGDFNRFSMEPITRLDSDGWIGVGSYKRGVVFHRIAVREVTGKGKFTRGTVQQANNTAQPVDYAAWKKDAIDLLPLIDPKEDVTAGTWAAGTSGLEATDLKCMSQKIQPPYRPAEEYDYRVSFSPIEGNADVAVGLSATGRSFAFFMKRYASDHCSGFECINGKIIASGPTARRFPHLELGRRYTVFVEVRKDGLKAWLDGELMAQWATDYHDMSPFRVWKFKDDTLLGVGCSLSRVVFHEIEVREVTGKGEFTRATAKTSGVDDAFMRDIAESPAERQVIRVVAKLKELNPAFDGKERHRIRDGQVIELDVRAKSISDLSPVRALVKLERLECGGLYLSQSPSERSPLSDLTPLKGLPLEHLDCGLSEVSDLSPLRGMLLTFLCLNSTKVTDLKLLHGMPLKVLDCVDSEVTDLKPLQGMPLTTLGIKSTQVSDLSPLRTTPLTKLTCNSTRIGDFSPLKDTPLKELRCDFDPERDTQVLRSIKTLERINGQPVADFWKQVEAGKIPPPPK